MLFLFLLALAQPSSSTPALWATPIGESGGFKLSQAISALPLTAGTPWSVLAFQNSAGQNKLLVVDSMAQIWITDDVPAGVDASSLPVFTSPAGGNGQLVQLDGDIFLVDFSTFPGSLITVHADGTLDELVVQDASSPLTQPIGLAANPNTHKLYVACSGAIYSIDADRKAFIKVVDAPANNEFKGITFSHDYNILYASVQSPTTGSVLGYALVDGVGIEISHSPDLDGAFGVLAGTGCLADYLFVLTDAGLAQIDFHGVDELILAHNIPSAAHLSFDPIDGTMLIPDIDGVYRLRAPACGGFTGASRFRAQALPVGHNCAAPIDCSSNNCHLGQCGSNTYLGACQRDSDCVDVTSMLPGSLFCQAASVHTNPRRPRKHNDADAVRTGPIYGVCEINACVNNFGGCDTNSTCVPTGDSQRVCNCNTGFFGTGLIGKCVNPCLKFPFPCDSIAACQPLSLTQVTCTCPTDYFSAGTAAAPCLPDPCRAAVNTCGAGHCTPLTATTSTCECTPGNFGQSPLPPPAPTPYTVAYPKCVRDICAEPNNGGCGDGALCTPTAAGVRTCACLPGWVPDGAFCKLGTCNALEIGLFPLKDAYSSTGTCVARLTGQSCLLGCVDGWRPVVAGKKQSAVKAQCTFQNGASIYVFEQFDCVPEAGAKAPGSEPQDSVNDADNKGKDKAAWFCGVPVDSESPCQPQAPWVSSKDRSARRVTLRWNALGASPNGDVVSSLVVHITPTGAPAFSTSPIPNPAFATSLAVDNLTPGVIYTFRLHATTNNGFAIGLPLTTEF